MKNPAAVELGRLGGLRGGPARAAALSQEQRKASAKAAAGARWGSGECSCVDCRRVHSGARGLACHKCPGRVGVGKTREQMRSGRAREVRSKTISVKRMTKQEIELGRLLYPETNHHRPKTRGECRGGRRPCPYVSCKFHLFVDVTENGSIKLNFPDLEPDELAQTCSLDVADRGGETLEGTAAILNITRERLRQIEVMAFEKIRGSGLELPSLADFEHAPLRLPMLSTQGIDDTESAPFKPAHTPATEAAQLAVVAEIRSAEASARSSR